MNSKQVKRKCKVCSKEFIKRSPLDMFCSPACPIAYNKKLAEKKSAKQKQPIKKFSDARAKRNAAYLIANKAFLMEEENQFCPVMGLIFNKTVRTTEVHHTNGRENDRLLDRTYWLAVSREGHQWIHSNPKIAYEQGWLTEDYKSNN
jgi:hypothetical protein